ncbi:hypothetical protein [Elizabethkingia anophelis]|uniref:hypothetical protein n=1 Tax=Elizabethkingia anophelis TaxID=1117645 RepID=UPI0011120201|nr:hypothetical protein [Elizabethkingia anophelis]MCT3725773.1 hypothetical protein [Elizabethkingia anophelis]
MKYKRLNSLLYLSALGYFLTGCSSERDASALSSSSVLSVNIAGIEEMANEKNLTTNSDKTFTTNNQGGGKISGEIIDSKHIKTNDFEGIISISKSMEPIESSGKNFSKTASANGAMAASTPITKGFSYKVLLYKNGTFYSSTLGTSGNALDIPVKKGDTYDWVIYSYNDTGSIPDPGNTNTPTIPTPTNRDLIHASGTVTIPGKEGDGQEVKTPLSAVLKHKLAKIVVKLDASKYPADITSASANFVSKNTYFQTGTFNLKDGLISNPSYYTADQMNFGLLVPNDQKIRVSNYYTVANAPINSLGVNLTALSLKLPDNSIKTLPTALAKNFNVTPQLGYVSTLAFNFLPSAIFTADCSSINVVGDIVYQNTIISSNHAINVNVTNTIAGQKYYITTNTIDGVSYSANGTFSSAGTQTISLKATGQYTTSGAKTFTINFNNTIGSICTANVNVGSINTGDATSQNQGLALNGYPNVHGTPWWGLMDAYDSNVQNLLAANSIVSTDVRTADTGEPRFYFLYFRNVSSSPWSYSYTSRSNLTTDPSPRTGSGTLQPGQRLPLSLDPYGANVNLGEGQGYGYYGSGYSWPRTDGSTGPESVICDVDITYQGLKYSYEISYLAGDPIGDATQRLYNSYLITKIRLKSISQP